MQADVGLDLLHGPGHCSSLRFVGTDTLINFIKQDSVFGSYICTIQKKKLLDMFYINR